tara:strand:- start:55 stop:354 length:300 start_codon:yes stop_codon:yes gene_type:complete
MINNKKKKTKREKKKIEYRTKQERQDEIKEILIQLTHFNLDMNYAPVKLLYKKFKEYISTGQRIIVNIPFPEINRRIKGILAISKNEEVTIALLNEKFN